MKFSLAILSLVGCAVRASEDVGLEVTCNGLDYNAVNAKGLSFAAHAVEKSFNSVHKTMALTDVTAYAPKSQTLRGGVAMTFRAVGDGETLIHSTDKKIWEAELTAMLKSGDHSAFRNAHLCSIKLESGCKRNCNCGNFCPNDDMAADTWVGASADGDELLVRDVMFNVQCDDVSFAELSLQALSYATKELKYTYNTVHSESALAFAAPVAPRLGFGSAGSLALEEGDFYFSATGVEKSSSSDLENDKLESGCKRNCNCGNFCPNDDDLTLSTTADVDPVHKAWEDLFLARLLQDSKGEFKNVKGCKISITSQAPKSMA